MKKFVMVSHNKAPHSDRNSATPTPGEQTSYHILRLGLRVAFISSHQLRPLDPMNDMAHRVTDLEVVISGDWDAGVVRILHL
jgi:hypothetical protein